MKNNTTYASKYLKLSSADYELQLKLAFEEDGYEQDVSTLSIFEQPARACAHIIARESGIIAGLPVVQAAFTFIDKQVQIEFLKQDGETCSSGDLILSARGDIRSLLRAERVALNFLGFLSGIATATRRVCDALQPMNIRPLDTRKTIPGLRRLSKYAVALGGGYNHRMSLADMGLIKDNHIAQAGSVTKAIKKFREKYPNMPLEVEVDTIEQLREALPLQPDMILLDNMNPGQLKECVNLIRDFNIKYGTNITSEASGGFRLDNLDMLTGTGVDYVSLGSLTSHVIPIDFSLEIQNKIHNS